MHRWILMIISNMLSKGKELRLLTVKATMETRIKTRNKIKISDKEYNIFDTFICLTYHPKSIIHQYKELNILSRHEIRLEEMDSIKNRHA